MKMRKSISKIMALLLAVTVMASMIAIPAMASGTSAYYAADKMTGGSKTAYTMEQFVADLNAAEHKVVSNFDSDSELKKADGSVAARGGWTGQEDVFATYTATNSTETLRFQWKNENNGNRFFWHIAEADHKVSGSGCFATQKDKLTTIGLTASGDLKPIALGYAVYGGNNGKTHNVTVTYTDGTTATAEPTVNTTIETKNTPYFYGFKAPEGKYIQKIEIMSNDIMYFDDVCVILEDINKEEITERDYYAADKMTGGSKTAYTMDQFVADLDAAEHKVVSNFDGSEDLKKADGSVAARGGWTGQEDVFATYTATNSTETLRFQWKNENNGNRFFWHIAEADHKVSGSGCFATQKDKLTTIGLTASGDLKPIALGYAVYGGNNGKTHNVTVTYTDGTTATAEPTVNTTIETKNTPYFYGFKAPEGKYIQKIEIMSNDIMYYDDVCVILEDMSVDYTDLEYATEMLQIYGDNFTEYVPLDSFGAQQDDREPRITISWASSEPTVVTTDGKVYPVVGVEKKVKLTATLTDTSTNETATKEFTVTIPAVSEYVIEGVKLTGTDGLIDTQLVAGKTIEKVSVKRYENSRQNITVVTALYDGQKNLADVKIETATPAIEPQAHGDITLTDPLTLPADITGYTAKIMLLSSKNELVPLCPDYTVSPMSQDITVFMVGDSLTADYTNSNYPRTGWGSCVETYIKGVTVDNLAVSGMSTKTFMVDGTKLPHLEENVKEGDYIFLMFGHNDAKTKSRGWPADKDPYVNQHSGIGKHGNISGDTLSYFGYISNIVKVAREKKANIVFFTQFARANTEVDNLAGYPAAMTAFANEQNLPVIDTTTTSLNLYAKLLEKGAELVSAGTATSATDFANNIFLYLTKEDPRYTGDPRFTNSSYYTKEDKDVDPVNGIDRTDDTHFNVLGANVRAKLAVLGLVGANNALARFENVTEADFNALCNSVIAEILATEYYGKVN